MDWRDAPEFFEIHVYNVPNNRARAGVERLVKEFRQLQGGPDSTGTRWLWGEPLLKVLVPNGDTQVGRWLALAEVCSALNENIGPTGFRMLGDGVLGVCAGGLPHDPGFGLHYPGWWLLVMQYLGEPGGEPWLSLWELEPGTEAELAQRTKGVQEWYEALGWEVQGATITYPARQWHERADAAWVPASLVGGPADGKVLMADTRWPNLSHSRWTRDEGAYFWDERNGQKALYWRERCQPE